MRIEEINNKIKIFQYTCMLQNNQKFENQSENVFNFLFHMSMSVCACVCVFVIFSGFKIQRMNLTRKLKEFRFVDYRSVNKFQYRCSRPYQLGSSESIESTTSTIMSSFAASGVSI